jgi:hypothetical protein
MKAIKSFLEIIKTFDSHQVHNMLALMWILISNLFGSWKDLWGVEMQSTLLLNMT